MKRKAHVKSKTIRLSLSRRTLNFRDLKIYAKFHDYGRFWRDFKGVRVKALNFSDEIFFKRLQKIMRNLSHLPLHIFSIYWVRQKCAVMEGHSIAARTLSTHSTHLDIGTNATARAEGRMRGREREYVISPIA